MRRKSSSLLGGSIKGIDHVTFGYPRRFLPRGAISFFASLGVEVTKRDELRRIDDFLPGTRYDFRIGETTVTFAPGLHRFLLPQNFTRRFLPPSSHLAFEVSPETLDRLLRHPRIDNRFGTNGKVRWGTGDWSVFMHGPYGLRFEFRCPTAHHLDE